MIVICYVWIGWLRQYNNNFGVIYGHSFPSQKKTTAVQQYYCRIHHQTQKC